MRQGLSVLAVAAMLVEGPAFATLPPPQQAQQVEQGLCRTPGPLPVLGAETRQPRERPVPYAKATVGALRAEAASEASDMPPPAPPPPLSPPPPVAMAMPAVRGDAAAAPVAGEALAAKVARSDEATRRPPIHPPYPVKPPPRPQAGLLTAGEHDDLLNPELYADYVRRSNLGQRIPDLPVLDTARVLTVEVRDRGGNPVRGAMVEVTCADGNRLRLPTMADGTVALFPELDRLGTTVRIAAAGQGARRVDIARGPGGERIVFRTNSIAAMPPPSLDLMLAIDTTGSMGDEIRYLQSELAAIVDSLRARHRGLDIRLGFVFYRDTGDDYVTNTVPLSSDISAGQAVLAQRYAGGGGDYPEAMEQALIRAAAQQWRPGAVKTLLVVADAPPHDGRFGKAWLAAEHLRASRVHIVPVAASGVGDKAEYLMRAMAAATQSRYTFLTDDSGIGNPHAPPAIDCYLVTRLDALLRRVIDSQLSGRRIEPDKAEVIREVGQYDAGRCVIPKDFGQS